MGNVADPPPTPKSEPPELPGPSERLAMLQHLLRGDRFTVEKDGDEALLARPSGVDVRPLRITCEPWPPAQDTLWFMVDGVAFEAAWALDHIETAACLIGARLLSTARRPPMLEPFTPAQKLHAALRRQVPQMAAALVHDDDTGLTHVQVTYRHTGPYEVEWSGRAYRWRPGPDDSGPLPADPEEAADAIGDALGVSRLSET